MKIAAFLHKKPGTKLVNVDIRETFTLWGHTGCDWVIEEINFLTQLRFKQFTLIQKFFLYVKMH